MSKQVGSTRTPKEVADEYKVAKHLIPFALLKGVVLTNELEDDEMNFW